MESPEAKFATRAEAIEEVTRRVCNGTYSIESGSSYVWLHDNPDYLHNQNSVYATTLTGPRGVIEIVAMEIARRIGFDWPFEAHPVDVLRAENEDLRVKVQELEIDYSNDSKFMCDEVKRLTAKVQELGGF